MYRPDLKRILNRRPELRESLASIAGWPEPLAAQVHDWIVQNPDAPLMAVELFCEKVKAGAPAVAVPTPDPSPETPTRPSSGTWILRFWRGGFGLGVTYWVFGLAVGIVVQSANALFVHYSEVEYLSVKNTAFALAALIALYFVAYFWLFVGTWRSARHSVRINKATGQGSFWARLVLILMPLYLIGVSAEVIRSTSELQVLWPVVSEEDASVAVSLELDSDPSRARFVGPVVSGAAGVLRDFLAANPQVRTLNLSSDGGYVVEGQWMATFIENRGLRVEVSSDCASACTLAFLGGNERVLHPGGRLGFHRFAVDGVTDQETLDSVRVAYDGLADEFIDRITETPFEDMFFVRADEAFQLGLTTTRVGWLTQFDDLMELDANAMRALRLAVVKGDPARRFDYARRLTIGRSVTQDHELAVFHLQALSDGDSGPAQVLLAEYYARGLGGLERNEAWAAYWAARAARNGQAIGRAIIKDAQPALDSGAVTTPAAVLYADSSLTGRAIGTLGPDRLLLVLDSNDEFIEVLDADNLALGYVSAAIFEFH